MHQFLDMTFMPHAHCVQWSWVMWVIVTAHAFIAAAYFVIPSAMDRFCRMRPDLAHPLTFRLYKAFIVLCGLTHACAIWMFFAAYYEVYMVVLVICAVVSVASAVYVVRALPVLADLLPDIDDALRRGRIIRALGLGDFVWEVDGEEAAVAWDDRSAALFGKAKAGRYTYADWARGVESEKELRRAQAHAAEIAEAGTLYIDVVRYRSGRAVLSVGQRDKSGSMVGFNLDVTGSGLDDCFRRERREDVLAGRALAERLFRLSKEIKEGT